jgi:uracil-DNA glycosylase
VRRIRASRSPRCSPEPVVSNTLFPDADVPDNRLKAPLADAFRKVAPGWRELCDRFLASEAGRTLCAEVDRRVAGGTLVFPRQPLRALRALEPANVRVVILGQDPYHGLGEAEGLAFSVAEGERIPPSLRNIHQELEADLGIARPDHGSLARWVGQGVLLLNSSLSVDQDRAGSHARLGWRGFTDAVVAQVAADPLPKVFMLWGVHAQAKLALINASGPAHLCLCSNHPSPLSARRPPVPFLGSAPFSRASIWLASMGRGAVDWHL